MWAQGREESLPGDRVIMSSMARVACVRLLCRIPSVGDDEKDFLDRNVPVKMLLLTCCCYELPRRRSHSLA